MVEQKDKKKEKNPNIRINFSVDYEINPILYEKLKKVNKRKRATLLRRLLEEKL